MGCVRGTLGAICFIACASRPSPLIARCPLGLGPLASTTPTSPAALPFPCLGLGAVAFYYPYWYAYVTCVHGGVVPAWPASSAYVR